MSEFKQIIGRGTRLREDYDKLFFNILDYTGTATAKFADPDFDGDPVAATTTTIDASGNETDVKVVPIPPSDDVSQNSAEPADPASPLTPGGGQNDEPRKFYVDGGTVEVVQHQVYELDADGKRLTARRITDYTGEKVRTLYPTPAAFRAAWTIADKRASVVEELAERGIDLATLATEMARPDDDPFDLLCHLAWDAPLRTRRERAERLRTERKDLFERYGPDARAVLEALLSKYADHGADELRLPDALRIEPVASMGNPSEIVRRFGGADQLRNAVAELQEQLYAA
jgi:type I restriction enzyme R subunit